MVGTGSEQGLVLYRIERGWACMHFLGALGCGNEQGSISFRNSMIPRMDLKLDGTR